MKADEVCLSARNQWRRVSKVFSVEIKTHEIMKSMEPATKVINPLTTSTTNIEPEDSRNSILLFLKWFTWILMLLIMLILIGSAVCIIRYTMIREGLIKTMKPTIIVDADAFIDKDLRVGDIVVFSKRDPGIISKVVGGFLGACFYHIAIVVRSREESDPKLYFMHFLDSIARGKFFEPIFVCNDNLDSVSISDIQVVLPKYKDGTMILVLRNKEVDGAMDNDTIWRYGLEVGCGRSYDRRYIAEYLLTMVNNDLDTTHQRMHCNTFLGKLLEALGIIPVSSNPLADYTPGSINDLIMRTDRFTALYHVLDLSDRKEVGGSQK
jgi:hypothetical protein